MIVVHDLLAPSCPTSAVWGEVECIAYILKLFVEERRLDNNLQIFNSKRYTGIAFEIALLKTKNTSIIKIKNKFKKL